MTSLIEGSMALVSSIAERLRAMSIIEKRRAASVAKSPFAVIETPPIGIPTAVTSKRLMCKVRLIRKEQVANDCILLRFDFEEEGMIIPVGKHVKIVCSNPYRDMPTWNGKENADLGEETIERKYTPINNNETGFTLVVKVYAPRSEFPDGGKMSRVLSALEVGETIDTELPFGLIQYFGNGLFKRSKTEVHATDVLIIVGGSGVTPMVRLVDEALKVADDSTKLFVIDANRKEENIICKSMLDELVQRHSKRLQLTHVLSNPSATWEGHKGHVNKELIMEAFPRPSNHTLVLVCGPPPMMESVLHHLGELGYNSKHVWEF